MSNMYSLTEEELVADYNRVKDLLFERLEAAGIIVSAEDCSLNYVVELVGHGRFGKWWDKAFGIEKGKTQMRVLKIEHVREKGK